MLAGLLSLYQLVLYLYQMLAELLYISVSVFRFHLCLSLSIQRSPEHSFYYCLQSSLPKSVHLSKLLYNAELSNLLSTPPFITSRQRACASKRLIFWVFVAGEFDRQTTVLLYRCLVCGRIM